MSTRAHRKRRPRREWRERHADKPIRLRGVRFVPLIVIDWRGVASLFPKEPDHA